MLFDGGLTEVSGDILEGFGPVGEGDHFGVGDIGVGDSLDE